MSKPRAFVIEPCKLDLSSAETFGEIVYIFRPNERRPSIWDEAFRQEIVDRLTALRFNPTKDFFVVAGHMVPIVIATGIIVRLYDTARALFYSAPDCCYTIKDL